MAPKYVAEIDSEATGDESAVEEIEPEAPAAPAGEEVGVDVDHQWLWLARTNRASKCATRGKDIPKATYKVIYHPFATEADKKQTGGGIVCGGLATLPLLAWALFRWLLGMGCGLAG